MQIEIDNPGVRPADQARSRKLQEKFVSAGQQLLLGERLSDISVPVLAKKAKSSVGGFYSRFENKEAFFEFLRQKMLEENGKLFEAKLSHQELGGEPLEKIYGTFVDTMIEVFSGRWRGVLREAYASIPEKQDSWKPMRARGQQLRHIMAELLDDRLGNTPDRTDRLNFAIQLLFSALNNELMNPNLTFSIGDPKFRQYLVDVFVGLLSHSHTVANEGNET